MKKVFCAVLAVVFVMTTLLCVISNPAAAADKRIVVGLVAKHPDDFMKTLVRGGEDAGKELGVTVKPLIPQSATDIEGQIQMIESLISSGIDAICVAPINPDTVVNVLQGAIDAGIKVVMVDTDAAALVGKTSYVSISNEEAAYQGALAFSDILPKNGGVVILGGVAGDTNAIARNNGFQKGFDEKGIKVLQVTDTQWTSEEGASITEDMITRFGDGLNGVIAAADDVAVGAIQSIRQAGREGKVLVCGFGGFAQARPFIEDGSMDMTIGMQPYQTGYQGVVAAVKAVKGESVAPFIDTGVSMTDKSNAADFNWF